MQEKKLTQSTHTQLEWCSSGIIVHVRLSNSRAHCFTPAPIPSLSKNHLYPIFTRFWNVWWQETEENGGEWISGLHIFGMRGLLLSLPAALGVSRHSERLRFKIHKFPIHYEKLSFSKALRAKRAKRKRTRLGSLFARGEGDNLILKPHQRSLASSTPKGDCCRAHV